MKLEDQSVFSHLVPDALHSPDLKVRITCPRAPLLLSEVKWVLIESYV